MLFKRKDSLAKVELDIGDLVRFLSLPERDQTHFLDRVFIVTRIRQVNTSDLVNDYWQIELACEHHRAYLYPAEDDFEVVSRLNDESL
jgi:hypothetical protein